MTYQRPSRHQMRRHVRKMRRYGLQPMTIINPGDPLPEVAAVVIGRWLWHYCSELAPLAVTLATGLAAWWLHGHDAHWWPLIAALAAASVPLLIVAGSRLGLADLAERLYASTVTASTGTWLATATAAGPFQSPLPQLLLIGSLVLAVPWWTHRRRRAKVRVERMLAGWPEIAQAIGLAGSRVQSAIVDLWGWRARFALARGQTISDVIAKLPAIESALGTHRGAVRVYPTPDDLAHRFELRVLDRDPHADAITWPGPSVASITEPVDLGPFEDAAPAKILLLRRHVLVGGVSGSGKSGGLNVLMANLAACADVVIWAIDLKRGMELGPWASCIDRPALDEISAQAMRDRAQTHPNEPGHQAIPGHANAGGRCPEDARDAPDAILWAALSFAPSEGVTVPHLMNESGMSRPWVYQRLQDLARRGQVVQVTRGRWRVSTAPGPGEEGDDH